MFYLIVTNRIDIIFFLFSKNNRFDKLYFKLTNDIYIFFYYATFFTEFKFRRMKNIL